MPFSLAFQLGGPFVGHLNGNVEMYSCLDASAVGRKYSISWGHQRMEGDPDQS